MDYEAWKKEFIKDKVRVPMPSIDGNDFAKNIERFQDGERVLWETGITYTRRVVVRRSLTSGASEAITWSPWQTLHHILIPSDNDGMRR